MRLRMDLKLAKIGTATLAALALLIPTSAHAEKITIQGRVTDASLNGITGAATMFRVKILSPDANKCVLYDETQTIDLSQTNGLFSLNLNSGAGFRNAPTTYSLVQAISNRTSFTVNASYCAGGGTGTITYTPAADHNRKVLISFRDPSKMAAFETIPEMDLNPMAYAIDARQTGGFPATSLLRVVDTNGDPASTTALSSGNFTELLDLLNGVSTNYMSSTSGASTGARLPTVNGDPTSPTAGSLWFDTAGSGALKFKDSAGAIRTVGTGTGDGTITGVSPGTGLAGGGTTGAISLGLAPSGVGAGSVVGSGAEVPVITYDTYGRITHMATAPIANTLPSGTSGEFLKSGGGSTWASSSIKMADLKNAAGTGALFGSVGCTSEQALYWDSGADQFRCQAITVSASTVPDLDWSKITTGKPTNLSGYGITDALHNADGSVPSISSGLESALPTPSAANLNHLYIANDAKKIYRQLAGTWQVIGAPPTAPSATSVTAPITNSGTATTPTIGITQASGSTNGFLSSTDWNTFNNKLSASLGTALLWVGNASSVPTPAAPSGNVAMDSAGKFTVTGFKDQSISAAATAAGQILRYEGSNTWTPRYLSMGDLRSNTTGAQTLGSGCSASQTLTWNSGTDSLQCQNISVAAASQITGVLPVANGGTGAASAPQAYVFAGPVSGGAGAPSFRPLSASDLPAVPSVWDAVAGGINYAAGRVGIGTTAPHSTIQVAGSVASAYASATSAYTLAIGDSILGADASSAPFTVTLPSAVGIAGRQYVIKKKDASVNAVTVATTASQTMDGATTLPLTSQYQSITLVSDGANWMVNSAAAASIPSGAVMSFDLAACPSGWTAFTAAQNRVIVGAGGSYALDSTGGAASATSSSAGAHAHAGATGATALSLAEMPSHTHGVTDPGHAHSVYDPGHAHGVYDPGHSHQQNDHPSGAENGVGYADGYQYPGRISVSGNWGYRDVASGTGIGIYGAGTGIGIYGAGTGISIQANGSGAGHTHPIGSDGAHTHTVDVRDPYVALLMCKKL